MSRYILWDHNSMVITPSGEVFTPQQWEERYPAAQLVDFVMSGGSMNGALMNEYSSMVDMYAQQGCDFSACTTKQECLDAIEAFEDAQNEAAQKKQQEEAEAEAQAAQDILDTNNRIADALQDLVVLNMPDA